MQRRPVNVDLVGLPDLIGLPADEIRRAKLLYLRNALSTLRTTPETLGLLWLFAIIPVFLPIVLLWNYGLKRSRRLQRERIENALTVWDDLGEEGTSLRQALDAIRV